MLLLGNEENQCVVIMSGQPVGLWKPMTCTSSNQFICKRAKTGYTPPTRPPSTTVPPPCPTGWKTRENFCYKV